MLPKPGRPGHRADSAACDALLPHADPKTIMSLHATAALLLYCRPGFENECAREVSAACSDLGVTGYAKTEPQSGWVLYLPHGDADQGEEAMHVLRGALRFDDLVFARQLVFCSAFVDELPEKDRLPPLVAAARTLGCRCGVVWLETADTNDAKELSGFCRRFAPHLEQALIAEHLLHPKDKRAARLNVFFVDATQAWVGLTDLANSSPWPMGIARLRVSRDAPSRSAVKLSEAWLALMTGQELDKRLVAGMRAADLGAAPGGWSWQLAQRGLRVIAIDNGNVSPALLKGEMVEHLRADGFHWRPRGSLDWMVCDIADQPSRIALLAADWIAHGRCRDTIFNLKLPMKKRFEELQRCRTIIDKRLRAADVPYLLRIKHLYHDREEVTAYLRAIA